MNKLLNKYYQFHRLQMAKKLAESGAEICYIPAPVPPRDGKAS